METILNKVMIRPIRIVLSYVDGEIISVNFILLEDTSDNAKVLAEVHDKGKWDDEATEVTMVDVNKNCKHDYYEHLKRINRVPDILDIGINTLRFAANREPEGSYARALYHQDRHLINAMTDSEKFQFIVDYLHWKSYD